MEITRARTHPLLVEICKPREAQEREGPSDLIVRGLKEAIHSARGVR